MIDHVNHISIWKHSEEWKYREVQRGKYKAEKHNEAAGKERRRGTDQAWYRARVVQQTTEDSTSAWKTATLHARTNFGILSCFLSGPIFLSLIIWFYNPVLGHCLFSEKQLTIYVTTHYFKFSERYVLQTADVKYLQFVYFLFSTDRGAKIGRFVIS